MPTPTIPAGNLFMNATLYTGNGSTQTITNGVAGQSFQPDFVWAKSRSNTNFHNLMDSVRGTSKILYSNSTGAEETNAQIFTALNSNGFSVGTDNSANQNGQTFVAWQWKAGGAAVTNTAGTISSQVSANTTSGFSVVTYTGNSTSGATVGHGLGVAPSMVIVKFRKDVASDGPWYVYHSSIGATKNLILNTTAGEATASTPWNNTAPTSSVFSLGNAGDTNGSGRSFVAYCWAPIAGYSAFGSYTGNGSADGPFVYLGFRPRFILVKSTSASNWFLWDTARNAFNATTTPLFPNNSSAEEGTLYPIDVLSNGFKLRGASGLGINESSLNYIYMAFAENPLKYANAR